MAVDELRPVWGAPGLYVPGDGMSQIPGGSGLFDSTGFTESPAGSGLFAFTEIPATAATLTPHMAGNPWVEVYFPQLDPSTEWVTIYRFSDNRTWQTRGGVRLAPGVPVQDFEVPYNVQSTYRAQMFAADGSDLGFTEPVSITIEVPEGFTTVHQVLDPSLWTEVEMLEGTAASLVRKSPSSVVYPEGAAVPKRIGSRRQALSDLQMSWLVRTPEAADVMQQMLGDYEQQQVGVLCVRTTPPMRVPRTLFISADDLAETEINVHAGGSLVRYDFSGDEVEPPYPGLVMPVLTYDDIDASFATYDDADAAFPTYTDRDRAYDLAGAAG